MYMQEEPAEVKVEGEPKNPSNVIVLVPKNVDSGSPSNILRIC